MTNREFINAQAALGLTGKELADKLGVHPTAVSKWRLDREVPDYIAKAMEKLLQSVEVVIPLDVLMKSARLAESQGISFERYIGNLFRSAISESSEEPGNITPLPEQAESPSARVAEEPPGLYDSSRGDEPTGSSTIAEEPPTL